MPNPHRRILFAVIALAAAAACIDNTRPEYHVPTHTLMAVTDIAAGDSIQCVIFAQLALPDSIRAPWTGTASVQVRRYRNTAVGPVQKDTIATDATFNITRGAGDSISVAIRGPFSIVLSGQWVQRPYLVSGSWRCDDRIPLSSAAPGQANGTWHFSTDRLPD